MIFSTKRIRQWQRSLLDHVVKVNPRLGLEDRAEFFTRIFESYLPRESSILDIGGGWGFYSEPLRKRGHSVTVLEVVKPGFQKAPVVLYDANRFPFADKSFDVSLLITVLHHTPDPEKVLREVHRVTRKAVIVVEDIYRHRLGRLWTHLRDQFYNFELFGHPSQFRTKKDWLETLQRNKFSLVKEKELYTRLAGLRILNGVFILELTQ